MYHQWPRRDSNDSSQLATSAVCDGEVWSSDSPEVKKHPYPKQNIMCKSYKYLLHGGNRIEVIAGEVLRGFYPPRHRGRRNYMIMKFKIVLTLLFVMLCVCLYLVCCLCDVLMFDLPV